MNSTDPTLFFDGTCGFCTGIVSFVLGHDRSRTIKYDTLQSPTGTALVERYPHLRDVDSVVWLESGSGQEKERVYLRSDAALQVAKHLGGFWRIAVLAYVIPRPIRDAVYDLIAKHRHRLTLRRTKCSKRF